MHRILLIEDELILRTAVGDFLAEEGYHVLSAGDGESGLQLALEHKPDLILLDVMLPGRDGFAICKAMRTAQLSMPIILLTARGLVRDRVQGLDSGADDYVVKPFSLAEVAARIRAFLRRTHSTSTGKRLAEALEIGALSINLLTRTVTRHGKLVALSSKEYGLLKMLIEAEGQPVSRDELLATVWGYSPYVATRTVDNHVARLRAKIDGDAETPEFILTVPKIGYRLAWQQPKPDA